MRLIDICVSNLSHQRLLKDDVSHYRNICQHVNVGSLEKVLEHLRDTAEEKLAQVKAENLKDDKARDELARDMETEDSPEDLLLIAGGGTKTAEEKDKVAPAMKYLLDTYKLVLDTLRQNSKLLKLYSDTVTRAIDFCITYNRKTDFKRIGETLNSHLKQIIENEKVQQYKIPYPVHLNVEDCYRNILDMRFRYFTSA